MLVSEGLAWFKGTAKRKKKSDGGEASHERAFVLNFSS